MLGSALAAGGSVWWLALGHDHRHDLEHDAASSAAKTKPRYHCPMHPSIVQDHPGNCPICGMKLVPVKADQQAATSGEPATAAAGATNAAASDAQSSVRGHAVVDIDPERQQLIGLRTAEVTLGPVAGTWRTVGRVAVDETRVRRINVKVPGFVERIDVDFVGKRVRKGDPLFALFSPELLAAQEEYLLALRTRGALAKGGLAKDGDTLVESARRKLELWDVPASAIERIAATGVATRTLTVHSPVAGVVTKKDVVQGMRLEAGAMPYEIIDLSRVWVLADVYENELRWIESGMPATLVLNAIPDREFAGKVLFIDPLLDPRTRTVKVRLAFGNPDGELRPEMFGEVILHGKARDGLRIPQDAILDSGIEQIVFVALGNGKFSPRTVRTGAASGDLVEVVSGLRAGERVVTRANFLIDSESRLRSSLTETSGDPTPAPSDPQPRKQPESARVLPSTGMQPSAPAPGHTPAKADPNRAPAPGAAPKAAPPPPPPSPHQGHRM
jgi:Cu(I)/Ag(I) efflux system membrane fusion protein